MEGVPLTISPTTRESPDNKKHLLHCARMCVQQATIAKEFERGDEIVMRVWHTNIAQEWAIQENQGKKMLTVADEIGRAHV